MPHFWNSFIWLGLLYQQIFLAAFYRTYKSGASARLFFYTKTDTVTLWQNLVVANTLL